MPILNPLKPYKFSYYRVPDDKLPEGRISVPFSIQVTDTGDATVFQLPIGQITGHGFILDARTVQNVQNFSSFKSIDFVANFQTVNPETQWGKIWVFAQDSSETLLITPEIANDGTGDQCTVAGSLRIFSNASYLQIITTIGTGAGNLVNFSGNANNFERMPYIYTAAKCAPFVP